MALKYKGLYAGPTVFAGWALSFMAAVPEHVLAAGDIPLGGDQALENPQPQLILQIRPVWVCGQIALLSRIIDTVNQKIGFTCAVECNLPLAAQRHDLPIQF
jgi:hypothetical protein